MPSTKIKDTEITPQNVAEFFLSKQSMTPKKLQKLVYYAYAWFIALNNEDADHIENRLFKEHPEAWAHGPVFPNLYREYKEYGWSEIPKRKTNLKFENQEVQKFLETIWKIFGKYSADELESMTHFEDPWKTARKDCEPWASSTEKISDHVIYCYYNELAQKN